MSGARQAQRVGRHGRRGGRGCGAYDIVISELHGRRTASRSNDGHQSLVTQAMNVCLPPAYPASGLSVYMLLSCMKVVVVLCWVIRTCHRPSTRRDARRRGGCRCRRAPRPTRDETRPSPTTRALGTAAAPSCNSIEAGKRQGQVQAPGREQQLSGV